MEQAGSECTCVEFATSGGVAYFPGLARPTTIKADQLSEEEARELDHLVATSHFFDLPERMPDNMAPGAADYRQFTITITKGGQSHTMMVNEPVEDPELKRLISFLEGQVKIQRAKARNAQPKE